MITHTFATAINKTMLKKCNVSLFNKFKCLTTPEKSSTTSVPNIEMTFSCPIPVVQAQFEVTMLTTTAINNGFSFSNENVLLVSVTKNWTWNVSP